MSTKWIPIFILLLLLSGCMPATPAGPQKLTVMTHDSFAVSEEVLAAFETGEQCQGAVPQSRRYRHRPEQGHPVQRQPAGRRLLRRGQHLPQPGPGRGHLRALRLARCWQISRPNSSSIPSNRALPVDYGDVCLNYDKAYFAEKGICSARHPWKTCSSRNTRACWWCKTRLPPRPGWLSCWRRSATSATDGYLDYWQGLVANDVLVVNDWETAYYTEFSGSSGKGPRPIVVSYSSSPAFEVIYAEPPVDEPPTAAVDGRRRLLPPDRVRRHPERRQEPRAGARSGSISCSRRSLPGRHAAADVRLPGQPQSRARPRPSSSTWWCPRTTAQVEPAGYRRQPREPGSKPGRRPSCAEQPAQEPDEVRQLRRPLANLLWLAPLALPGAVLLLSRWPASCRPALRAEQGSLAAPFLRSLHLARHPARDRFHLLAGRALHPADPARSACPAPTCWRATDFRGKSLHPGADRHPLCHAHPGGGGRLQCPAGSARLGQPGADGAVRPGRSRRSHFTNTLAAILMAHVFYNTTIVLRMVGDFWSHLDPRLEQAAQVLGASRWQTLRHVTLPLLPAGDRSPPPCWSSSSTSPPSG